MQIKSFLYSVLQLWMPIWQYFGLAPGPCPCSSPSLCSPLSSSPAQDMLVWSSTSSHWAKYDWAHLTTLVTYYVPSTQLLCYAHQHGVRVLYITSPDIPTILDEKKMNTWINKTLNIVLTNYMDGVNIDFEEPILQNDTKLQRSFNFFLQRLYLTFKGKNKNYQITIDVPWSPDGIDDRFYNVTAMVQYSDYLVIMAYDEQAEIYKPSPCVAKANSPATKTFSGVIRYLRSGASAHKLLLALPWYGVEYKCLQGTEVDKNGNCPIENVPSHEAYCSEKAGKQVVYGDLMQILKSNLTKPIEGWNSLTMSPFFTFKRGTETHVIWYDNPRSLRMKGEIGARLGLRGLGAFHADCLDYSSEKQVLDMWKSLKFNVKG